MIESDPMKKRLIESAKSVLRIVSYYLGLGLAVFIIQTFVIVFSLPTYVSIFKSSNIVLFSEPWSIYIFLTGLSAVIYFSVGNVLSGLSSRKLLHSMVFAILMTTFFWVGFNFNRYSPVVGFILNEIVPPPASIEEAFSSIFIMMVLAAHIIEVAFVTVCTYAGTVCAKIIQRQCTQRILEFVGFSVWFIVFAGVWLSIGLSFMNLQAFPTGMASVLIPVSVVAIVRMIMLMKQISNRRKLLQAV